MHPSSRTPLKVLFVAAEAYPLVKTGGLGDVAGSLPRALHQLGVDVQLLLPAYADVLARADSLRKGPALGEPLPGHAARLQYGVLEGTDVPLTLVDCPSLFGRPGSPYQNADGHDWSDNHLRFAMLSRAAALLGTDRQITGWQPDLVHANDWHTALVPLLMRTEATIRSKSLFTIHNLAYQGLFPYAGASQLAPFIPPEHMHSLEFWGQMSFLKAGLAHADCVTTVSPTYAREITTPEYGCGLDGVINARTGHVVGITNGIDDDIWDPRNDSHLVANYDAGSLSDKGKNTQHLRRLLGLPEHRQRPVVGVVSRFVHQKGIDVILTAIPELLALDVDLVFLGTGETDLQAAALAAAAQHPDRIATRIAYDEALAHLVIAGADMLLMPSRFEPCGLTQLYGQRYGTLPVVHRVGGLVDTVHDGQDGFGFDGLTADTLVAAVRRARDMWADAVAWRYLQTEAMSKNLGWRACAEHYRNLYSTVIDRSAA